jgi:hypothetical protein
VACKGKACGIVIEDFTLAIMQYNILYAAPCMFLAAHGDMIPTLHASQPPAIDAGGRRAVEFGYVTVCSVRTRLHKEFIIYCMIAGIKPSITLPHAFPLQATS